MHVTNWTKYSPAERVHRRAGGRRRYNKERQRQAEHRRILVEARYLSVIEEFLRSQTDFRGWQTRLAKELGISRMQINRDFKRLLACDRTLSDNAFMLEALRIISKPIPGLERLLKKDSKFPGLAR